MCVQKTEEEEGREEKREGGESAVMFVWVLCFPTSYTYTCYHFIHFIACLATVGIEVRRSQFAAQLHGASPVCVFTCVNYTWKYSHINNLLFFFALLGSCDFFLRYAKQQRSDQIQRQAHECLNMFNHSTTRSAAPYVTASLKRLPICVGIMFDRWKRWKLKL